MFFLDADLKILSNDYFMIIYRVNKIVKKNVFLTKIKNKEKILPQFPITSSRIDISNICISRFIAEKYEYPSDIDFNKKIATDYEFYERIKNEGVHFLDFLSAERNGNNFYRNVISQILNE